MELNRKTLEDLLTLFPQLAEGNTVLRKYYGKKLLDMTDEEAAEIIEVEEITADACFIRKPRLHFLVKEISGYEELASNVLNTDFFLKWVLQELEDGKTDEIAKEVNCEFTDKLLRLLEIQQDYLDTLREHYADLLKETPLNEQTEEELTEDQLNGTCLNGINVQLDAIKIVAANKNEAIVQRIQHVYKLYTEISRLKKDIKTNFPHLPF